MGEDLEKIKGLISNYKEEVKYYDFSNAALFRLDAKIADIEKILDKYMSDPKSLAQLISVNQEFIMNKISKEKVAAIKEVLTPYQVKPTNQFYSYDGQVFPTLEEAAARNAALTMNKESSSTGRTA